jgi:DNA invertase Pin-like site-specific DNA recombinase
MRPKRQIRRRPTIETAKAVLYCRVSSEQQARSGLGLDDQERRLVKWAEENFVEDYIVVRDEGETATTSARPGWQQALTLLATGERNTLVALKLDRVARNTADVLALRDRLHAQNWNLVILDGHVQLDTRSANGKLMLTMFAAIAEWEADIISARTCDALNEKRARGDRGLVAPELEKRIVSLVDQLGLSGTARLLNAEGVPTAKGGREWYAATIQRVVERYERSQ